MCLALLLLVGVGACNGVVKNSASIGLDAGADPGTVRGTVVDEYGTGFPEVKVLIGSVVTVTDAEGHFTAHDIGSTYDVSLVPPSGVLVYQAMTQRAPLFMLDELTTPGSHNRAAHISFDMGASDTSSVKTTEIMGLDGNVRSASWSTGGTSGSIHPYVLYWLGDDPAPLSLRAFQYLPDPTSGGPASYTAYDSMDQLLSGGADVTWSPRWKPMDLPVATISGTFSLPPGYSAWSVRLFVRPTPQSPSSSPFDEVPQGSGFSFLVPDLPNATYEIQVLAGSQDTNSSRIVRGVRSHDAPLSLALEPGPTALAPLAGAQGVGVGTELSWTDDAPGVDFVNLIGSSPEYRITTAQSPARIPDLSALGVALPPGAAYRWAVFRTTASSTDELAAHGTEIPDLSESTYAYSGYIDVTISSDGNGAPSAP